MTVLFATTIFDDKKGYIPLGIYLLNILATLIPFFLSDKYGRKPFLFYGSIGIFILEVLTFIQLIIFRDNLDDYAYLLGCTFSLSYIFYGLSTYTLSFVYSVETLPERGFSFVMAFYWITISSMTISFSFILGSEKDNKLAFIFYTGFSVIITILAIPFMKYATYETMGLKRLEMDSKLGLNVLSDSVNDEFYKKMTEA